MKKLLSVVMVLVLSCSLLTLADKELYSDDKQKLTINVPDSWEIEEVKDLNDLERGMTVLACGSGVEPVGEIRMLEIDLTNELYRDQSFEKILTGIEEETRSQLDQMGFGVTSQRETQKLLGKEYTSILFTAWLSPNIPFYTRCLAYTKGNTLCEIITSAMDQKILDSLYDRFIKEIYRNEELGFALSVPMNWSLEQIAAMEGYDWPVITVRTEVNTMSPDGKVQIKIIKNDRTDLIEEEQEQEQEQEPEQEPEQELEGGQAEEKAQEDEAQDAGTDKNAPGSETVVPPTPEEEFLSLCRKKALTRYGASGYTTTVAFTDCEFLGQSFPGMLMVAENGKEKLYAYEFVIVTDDAIYEIGSYTTDETRLYEFLSCFAKTEQ